MGYADTKSAKSPCEVDAVHVVKRINHYTQGSTVLLFLKSSFLGLLEFACYLVAVLLVYFVFTTRNDILSMAEKINTSAALTREINVKELLDFFFTFKILLAAISLVPLPVALLLRNIRKKNTVLRKVNDRARDFLERHQLN